MRELSNAIIKAAQAGSSQEVLSCRAQLALNVNPFDVEDSALVQSAENLAVLTDAGNQVQEFTDRMALLLKHDWERAKREAHPWFFRGSEPKRVPYCEYKCAAPAILSIVSKSSRAWTLLASFGALSFSAGIIFFLAAGLTEPFQNLVKLFNDPKIDKSTRDWAGFVFLSVVCGSMWSAAYLWFKGSEKRFLEIFFSK